MFVYFYTIIFSLILYFIAAHTKIYGKKLPLFAVVIIASIPIFINGAIRYNVGTDYNGYLYNLYRYKIGIDLHKEFIYEFVESLIVRYNLDFQWIFVFFALIFTMFVMNTILRESPIPLLSIYLLFATRNYFIYLTASRQLCACAIVLFSIQYIANRKFLKFLICILIASGFHLSSLIWLPMYFLSNLKLNKNKIIAITCFAVLFRKYVSNLGLFFMSLSKWAYHMSDKYTATFSTTNLTLQIVLVILAFTYIKKENKLHNIYMNIQLFAFWIMIYSGTIPLVERLRYYFILPSICLIPIIINSIKSSRKKLLFSFIILSFYTMYMLSGTMIRDVYNILPYQTIFNIY